MATYVDSSILGHVCFQVAVLWIYSKKDEEKNALLLL